MRALLAFFIFCSIHSYGQTDLLMDVRQNVGEMFKTEEICTRLYQQFEITDITTDNLLVGYKGAVLLGMARHHPNPFKKMGFFSDGKELLENAIAIDSENLELRFLRLTIQTNIPSFLGYDSDKENDKAFVLNHIEKAKSEAFKTKVRNFIKLAEEEGKL